MEARPHERINAPSRAEAEITVRPQAIFLTVIIYLLLHQGEKLMVIPTYIYTLTYFVVCIIIINYEETLSNVRSIKLT